MFNLKKIIYTIQRGFAFRKPVFSHLDYIDLIIEDKALFLLSWKVANAHKIEIKPLGRKYYSKESSVIVRLENRPTYINIIASSFWRKNKKCIHLTYTRLDDQGASCLIHDFARLSSIAVKDLHFHLKDSKIQIRAFHLRTQIPTVRYSKMISINSSKFNYPSNTSYERNNDCQIL